MALLGRVAGFLDKYLFGYALGVASGPALEPFVQSLANEAWTLNQVRPPDAVLLAQGVAQGQVDEAAARGWAAEQGFADAAWQALVSVHDSGPGVAAAFELWRRGLIDEAAFRRALRRDAIEPEWVDALIGLRRRLLSPAELANAVVQGFRDLDSAAADAELQGEDPADFRTRVDVTGLPPGPETLLDWLRRGIIDEAGVTQGIREGRTKTKYVDEYLASRWRVLDAAEYANLYLRGWIDEAERDAGGALTGVRPEDMERMYLARGRPAAPVQMFTAWARGVPGPEGRPMDKAQFLRGIRQSDIRPEWGEMLWGIRYAYPSLFQISRLVTSGAIAVETALDWLRKSRYAPEVLAALEQAWSATGTATVKQQTRAELLDEYEGGYLTEQELRDRLALLGYTGEVLDAEVHLADARRVKRWRERAITAIGNAYVDHELDDGEALAQLAQVGVTGDAPQRLLAIWQLERLTPRRDLTQAAVRRAYRKGTFTRAEAVTRLTDLGYTSADAEVILDT